MAAKLSGGGGGRYDVAQNASINVTPFVDVMLVLLIIFMVAAPLASVTIKVALPPASAKPARKPPKIIYLSIKKDGRVFVGDDVQDIFQSHGLEVETVSSVEVRAHRLGIVVDDDGAVAVLAQRPNAVDTGIVKLDALADSDGA